MLIVRCTARLLERMPSESDRRPRRSSTRLGDWYATVVALRPVDLVLLVNERTRLAALATAGPYAKLPERLSQAIADVLKALGAPTPVVLDELAAMRDVTFARTESRSVLGTMNELAFHLGLAPPARGRGERTALAMQLNETPMSPLDWKCPGDVAKPILGIATPTRARTAGAAPPRGAESQAAAGPASRPAPPAGRAHGRVPRVLELHVALRGVRPEVWRRVQLHDAMTLQALHRVLQVVMGWENRHLHEFVTSRGAFARPDLELPAWQDPRGVRLSHVLGAPGERLLYRYDFGDGWEHDVTLVRELETDPGARYPRVVAGARACPPEDCGGEAGYAELLEALGDAAHPRHRELLHWVGGAFDPAAFDPRAVNRALQGAPRPYPSSL